MPLFQGGIVLIYAVPRAWIARHLQGLEVSKRLFGDYYILLLRRLEKWKDKHRGVLGF